MEDQYFNWIKNPYTILPQVKLFFKRIFSSIVSILKGILTKKKDLQIKNSDLAKNNKHEETRYDALEEQEEEIWYDALEEQEEETRYDALEEQEEEIWYDTLEEQEEDGVHYVVVQEEYQCEKYYSLQSGMEEKKEVDDVNTVLLAFSIDENSNNKVDLSTLTLQKIHPDGEDGYYFYFIDNNSNVAIFYTKRLAVYFPQFFKECGRSYTNVFINNDAMNYTIAIPLHIPKEANILTGEAPVSGSWYKRVILSNVQSRIPPSYNTSILECTQYIRLDFNSNSVHNNAISLSIIPEEIDKLKLPMPGLSVTKGLELCDIPLKTNWQIKDILIQGNLAKQIGINKIKSNDKKSTEYNNINANHKNTPEDNHTESTEVIPVKDCPQIEIEDVQTCKMKEPCIQTKKNQLCGTKEICACISIAMAVSIGIIVQQASLSIVLAGLTIVAYSFLKYTKPSTQIDEMQQAQPPALASDYHNLCNS